MYGMPKPCVHGGGRHHRRSLLLYQGHILYFFKLSKVSIKLLPQA